MTMIIDPNWFDWYVRGWKKDPVKPHSKRLLEAYELGWRDRERDIKKVRKAAKRSPRPNPSNRA